MVFVCSVASVHWHAVATRFDVFKRLIDDGQKSLVVKIIASFARKTTPLWSAGRPQASVPARPPHQRLYPNDDRPEKALTESIRYVDNPTNINLKRLEEALDAVMFGNENVADDAAYVIAAVAGVARTSINCWSSDTPANLGHIFAAQHARNVTNHVAEAASYIATDIETLLGNRGRYNNQAAVLREYSQQVTFLTEVLLGFRIL